jgi:hypothetical protein
MFQLSSPPRLIHCWTPDECVLGVTLTFSTPLNLISTLGATSSPGLQGQFTSSPMPAHPCQHTVTSTLKLSDKQVPPFCMFNCPNYSGSTISTSLWWGELCHKAPTHHIPPKQSQNLCTRVAQKVKTACAQHLCRSMNCTFFFHPPYNPDMTPSDFFTCSHTWSSVCVACTRVAI